MALWTRRQVDTVGSLVILIISFFSIIVITESTTVSRDNRNKCIALRFLNHVGGNFKVISTMKPEGYSVTTDEYKLRTIFRHSQLRHFVIFHGADDEKKKEILLDGEKTISVSPQSDCEHFADVIVTAGQGPPETEKKTPLFSETNLPADSPTDATKQSTPVFKEAPSISHDRKKSSPQSIEDADKKGKTNDDDDDDDQQYKEALETSENVPTISDTHTTQTRPTANIPGLTPDTNDDNKKQSDKEHEMSALTSLAEHLFTTNDDNDTNTTYVDEDLHDKEPTSNYHPPKGEAQEGGRSYYKKKRKSILKNKIKLKKENLKRKEQMSPLMLKSAESEILKNNDQKNDNSKYVLSRNRKLKADATDNNVAALSASLITVNNREVTKGIVSKNRNVKTVPGSGNPNSKAIPTVSLLNDISHFKKTREGASQIASAPGKLGRNEDGKTKTGLKKWSSQSVQGTHHTSLIHKDSRVDIVTENVTSDDTSKIKPRFIHSKAEAIEEIVKALGSNNKIVKDANGLYLISGKHVKIIHRTHKKKLKKYKNPKLSDTPNVRSYTGFIHAHDGQRLAPVLHIRTRKPSETLQGFSKSLFRDIKTTVGLPLSTYNLEDLEKKLQHNFPAKDEHLIKFQNSGERMPVNNTKGRKDDGNFSSEKKNLVAMKDLSNVVQTVKSKNDTQLPRTMDKNKTYNTTDGNVGNSKTKSRANAENDDPFKGSEKNIIKSLDTKDKIVDIQVHDVNRSLQEDHSNGSSENFISTFEETEEASQGLRLSNGSNVQEITQKPLLQENGSSPIVVPHDSSRDVLQNSSRDIPHDSSRDVSHDSTREVPRNSSRDRSPEEVHVEVVDEQKKQNGFQESTTPTEVEQNRENVEIIDEGSDVKEQNPSIEDISLALYAKFGKKRLSTESPGTTEPLRSTDTPESNGSLGTTGPLGTTGSLGTTGTLGTTGSLGATGTPGRKSSQEITESLGTTEAPSNTEIPNTDQNTTPESPGNTEIPNTGQNTTPESPGNTEIPNTGQNTPPVVLLDENKEEENETKIASKNDFNQTSTSPSSQPQSIKETSSSPDAFLLSEEHGAKQADMVGSSETSPAGTMQKTQPPVLDTSQNNGPLLTEDIQTRLSPNKNTHPATNSLILNKGSKGFLGTTRNVKDDGELMVPKRVVDALLANFIKKFQEKSIEKLTDKTNDKYQGRQADDTNISQNSDSTGENALKQERTKAGQKDKGTIEEVEEKVGFENHDSPKKSSENSKLETLLESFVKLLHKNLKKFRKPRKPKSRKGQFLYTKPRNKNTLPLLKYQEGLLWKQQRKLEHQLAVEEEMLRKTKEHTQVYVGLNEDSPLAMEKAKESRRPSRKGVGILRKLNTKLRRLNKEKSSLLNKLERLGFQHNGKSFEDEEPDPKVVTPNQKPSATDIYENFDQEPGIAPYMNSHITYKDVKDGGSNEETGSHSDPSLWDHEPSRNYEHIATATKEHTSAFEEPHLEPGLQDRETPDKELGTKQSYLEPEVAKDFGKSEDVLSYNAASHYNDRSPSTPQDGKQSSQENSQSLGEHLGQISQYKTLTSPSGAPTNVPDYPIPSFINKEANYASNTADMFVHSVPSQDIPQQEDRNQENFNERSKTNSLVQIHNLVQHEQQHKSDTRGTSSIQGGPKGTNVFPGTYSNGEDPSRSPGTPQALQWHREDAQLIKEMPEYTPQDNTIESKSEPSQYAVVTPQQQQPSVQQQVTTTTGSDSEEEGDGQEGNGNENEEFQKPLEEKSESAFEMVDGGDTPTMRRISDNPEDGETIINGDEYHLQKKYGIIKKRQKKKKI